MTLSNIDNMEGKKKRNFIKKTKIYMVSLKLMSISGVIEEKVINEILRLQMRHKNAFIKPVPTLGLGHCLRGLTKKRPQRVGGNKLFFLFIYLLKCV